MSPSRGADEHVETGAQHLALRLVAGPAEHHPEPQPGVHSDLLRVAVNLHRKLAGGREHDGAGLPASDVGTARLAKQQVHDSDQKCGGLAGAGLGLPFDIAACEHRGKRLRLDWRAVLEARLLEAAQNRRFEIETREPHVGEKPLGHRLRTRHPSVLSGTGRSVAGGRGWAACS